MMDQTNTIRFSLVIICRWGSKCQLYAIFYYIKYRLPCLCDITINFGMAWMVQKNRYVLKPSHKCVFSSINAISWHNTVCPVTIYILHFGRIAILILVLMLLNGDGQNFKLC